MSGHTHHIPGVVMFVMNDLLNDPRVQREARSAVRAGFRVTVIALQSDRCRIERESVEGYEVVRVRVHRFRVLSGYFRMRGLLSALKTIVKEGAKRALGLPPGPEAPGQAPGVPSRLRRIKWTLMQGVGVLLLPLRAVRPFLSGLIQNLKQGAAPDDSTGGLSQKQRQVLSEVSFLRDTLLTTFAMLRAARAEKAVVFHGNDLPTLPLTTWAAHRARGKALYDSHELWVGMSPEWTTWLNGVCRWVEHRYIRRVNAVVTVNDLIAEELQRRYQIPLPTVVMNCPEPVPTRAIDPRHAIRAKLGLSQKTPLILYQGRYERGRGLEELIESGRYLSRGVIVLRGYGSNEDELRRRIAGIGVRARVFMVEPVPMADLVDAAREADIGTVPYTACTLCNAYALPNKLFEYMLAGLAIAVSNLPVMEKLVRDHDLGVVFDPSDPRHIAEQLNALLDHPARLRACRENALRAARERYHWEVEGGKLVTLYRMLAGDAPPRGGSLAQ